MKSLHENVVLNSEKVYCYAPLLNLLCSKLFFVPVDSWVLSRLVYTK